uniref:Uncharacterized protein n=1 Tax=Trachysalambria curvirostris nimavirus TaxID=2984282 RepID=A0A9C7EZ23_9VIRU|nr:MAG: hypothetical protein [Trachysalambria curvirostris nimavirus]
MGSYINSTVLVSFGCGMMTGCAMTVILGSLYIFVGRVLMLTWKSWREGEKTPSRGRGEGLSNMVEISSPGQETAIFTFDDEGQFKEERARGTMSTGPRKVNCMRSALSGAIKKKRWCPLASGQEPRPECRASFSRGVDTCRPEQDEIDNDLTARNKEEHSVEHYTSMEPPQRWRRSDLMKADTSNAPPETSSPGQETAIFEGQFKEERARGTMSPGPPQTTCLRSALSGAIKKKPWCPLASGQEPRPECRASFSRGVDTCRPEQDEIDNALKEEHSVEYYTSMEPPQRWRRYDLMKANTSNAPAETSGKTALDESGSMGTLV